MSRHLKDMICLITGASSGIGQALARQLGDAGAKLVLVARRGDKLDSLNEELGGGHLVHVGDVSTADACRDMIDACYDRFGRLDTLVANAGYGISKPSWKQTPDEVRQMFATNVFGSHDLAFHAVPRMLEQDKRDDYRGQIVYVSSAAARRGLPFFGPYSATKAAQLSLAETMRVELADEKIAVTSVHPIGTTTSFFDVAEDGHDNTKVTGIGNRGQQQTAEHVASRMLAAIQKPVREVWPARVYRFLLGMTTITPGVGDRVMRKMKQQIDAEA